MKITQAQAIKFAMAVIMLYRELPYNKRREYLPVYQNATEWYTTWKKLQYQTPKPIKTPTSV